MKNKNILVKVLLVLIIFSLSNLIGSAAAATPIPKAYLIADVPPHKQINGLGCGPAALEIIFDFWGADIDQKQIADVARSSSIGTYTWDMVRTGHFSYLSAAQGRFFPHDVPTAGFPDRPIGYTAFSYSSNTFWWNDLKRLIVADIPVVLLMKYAPDDPTGHYRVVVGYDEDKRVVYFMDPWDRDQVRVTNPDGTVTWTMADFENAWNYDKYGTPHPYWGAVMMPWSVSLHTTGKTTAGSVVKVTADITYPCPQPFDCSAYPASNTSANISLPPGMHLLKGSSRINIGNLQAGGSAVVSWDVLLDADAAGSSITVKAGGQVSGAVPEANWSGNGVSYPAYNYTDEIGGEGNIKL